MIGQDAAKKLWDNWQQPQDKQGRKDRKPWQRLMLSLLGIAIIFLMWRWATNHLYTLPPHAIAAFAGITTNALYTVAAIVIFMVTGRLIYDWKNASSVVSEVKHLIIDKRVDPKDADSDDVP